MVRAVICGTRKVTLINACYLSYILLSGILPVYKDEGRCETENTKFFSMFFQRQFLPFYVVLIILMYVHFYVIYLFDNMNIASWQVSLWLVTEYMGLCIFKVFKIFTFVQVHLKMKS